MRRFVVFVFVFASASLLFPNSVGAVIITSGDGTSGNTSAPADDFGWANVGNRGVYLGNRWVLTAFHVGAGSINFGGPTFQASGVEHRIENPTGMGLSQFTDLLMFQLTQDPGLPMLTLPSGTPAVGTQVSMVGDGRDRVQDMTFWDSSFMETSPPGAFSGYKWTTMPATATMRWGVNLLSDNSATVDSGFGDVISIETTFDSTGLTHEAHATPGDSGGAVFAKNGPLWELAGIMHAVSEFENPDQPSATSVFGSMTYAADLATYKTQIENIKAIPEPGAFMLLLLVALLVGLTRFDLSFKRRQSEFNAVPVNVKAN